MPSILRSKISSHREIEKCRKLKAERMLLKEKLLKRKHKIV